ncbi:MAG: hypothetical protein JWM31_388 [Solirubrobacterales bacterium]|nr:hypothetical protein [Solirubrobacterales bacterium]
MVARRELVALGYSATAVDTLVHEGVLHRVTHAVYAVGHPHLTREGWWSVAVRAGGEGSILSHRASTAVRGLLRPVDTTDIIVPKSQAIALPHIRVHQATVQDEDREVIHGLPVTGLGRTLIDIAAEHPARLVEALEQAIILEVYDHAQVMDAIRRHRGYRGVARLRAAVAGLPDDPARFRSRAERQARDLIVAAGLPAPVVNGWHTVGASGGYELDLWWPRLRRNAEIDGPRHDLPWQRAADARRDAALRRHGVLVQRHRVEILEHDPLRFVSEIAEFLSETR